MAAHSVIQGVFHPAYRDLQRGAAALLGEKRLAVFKGGGGEAERNPDKSCRVFILDDGRTADEDWPALDGDAAAASEPEPDLTAIWRGAVEGEAPTRIVIATAALALRLVARADGPAASDALARELWAGRDKERFPIAAHAQPDARTAPAPAH